ncbi:50S ribosomal protein L22 [Dorea longicatena]|nr:50S ribosomal protein L22 [Dorea longicatena]
MGARKKISAEKRKEALKTMYFAKLRKAESGELFVTKIFVDGGATLKRMRPAPQGRGYRIRKRSNHVTLFVGSKSNNEDQN